MHKRTLFYALSGELLPGMIDSPLHKLTQDTPTCTFIEKGHVVEYIDIGIPGRKIAALFFGPNEFAVRSHPQFSELRSLDEVSCNIFTHGQIMHMLRTFGESRTYYRVLRKKYQEKVEDRIRTSAMTAKQQFSHLKKQQPWVLEVAKIEDIASYLNIPIGAAKTLLKDHK